MKILNPDWRDYHMHSTNFSDWTSTIDEIVKFSWDIWLEEIAITDHSDIVLENVFRNSWNKWFAFRWNLERWKNVFNDVNVIFWVEWDLVNEKWDICSTIQWIEQDFIILSAHAWVYKWEPETVTNWYINAIKRHHDKIKFIGHPCNSKFFSKDVDINRLIDTCNKFDIPMEFNASDFVFGNTDMEKAHIVLKNAKYIYVNSDAHSLYELKEHRKIAFKFLKENNYM